MKLQLKKLQKELNTALGAKKNLENENTQLQLAKEELQMIREQLNAAVQQREVLETRFVDLQNSESKLGIVNLQLQEAEEEQKRLQAEVSVLKAKEIEASPDLVEKLKGWEELTERVSALLEKDVDSKEIYKVLKDSLSARTALEKEITTLKAAENSKAQTLASKFDAAKTDLQLKDAGIQQALERPESINNQVLSNAQNSDVGADEYLEEIRKKDIKLKGLLEENGSTLR